MDAKASAEEKFLKAARMGNVALVQKFLSSAPEINVNCIGRNKWNRGWSPVHLSSYFGHSNVVKILLQNGADPNLKNNMGDTPLHKSALTARKEIVDVLIECGADARLINADGFKPVDITAVQCIKETLEAAEIVLTKREEGELLDAASANDAVRVSLMLKSPFPPNIDCVNINGNSPLHNAAYRGHKDTVLVLLQHRADTTLRNFTGRTACDLADGVEVKKILNLLDETHEQVYRFEGPLLKKRALLGFKPVFAVLDHGLLFWYSQKGELRQLEDFKFLLKVDLRIKDNDPSFLLLKFPNGGSVAFKVPVTEQKENDKIYHQRWLNALQEHRSYANHEMQPSGDTAEHSPPKTKNSETLEAMTKEVEAQYQILERCVGEAESLVQKLPVSRQQQRQGDIEHLLQCSVKFGEALHVLSELQTSLGDCVSLLTLQEAIGRASVNARRLSLPWTSGALTVGGEEMDGMDGSDFDSDEFFDAESEGDYPSPVLDHVSGTNPHRDALPFYRPSTDYSIWTILKHCIGKDLSRITLPVTVNEPLTFLQRTCEALEYEHLLQQALSCTDALERTKYVTAFFYSNMASCHQRSCKPFNPLLGETYELYREDRGYRVLAEQVSHHPPITALHCEGKGFTFHCSVQAQLKLTGRGLEAIPNGCFTLEFPMYNEVYTWSAPAVRVHNIIVGKLWLERYGVITVRNHSSGHFAQMDFKAVGWLGGDPHHVEGHIETPGNEVKYILRGKWTEDLRCFPVGKGSENGEVDATDLAVTSGREDFGDGDESSLLWKADPKPSGAQKMYGFTKFAISLNELSGATAKKIAPTDSRLRPDVRLMENGNIEGAAGEKHRLEEKQRAARRKRNEKKEEWVPRWFKQEKNEYAGVMDWMFTGDFWSRDFSHSPDIF